MTRDTVKLVLRRRAPILVLVYLLFAGLSAHKAAAQVSPGASTPAATRATPSADQTPSGSGTATSAPAASATIAAMATPTANAARQAKCEGIVAWLTGRSKDKSVLDDPEMRKLAAINAELVACGAVASDSDELCERLAKDDHDAAVNCRNTTMTFRELRAYPNSRSFFFDQVQWENCHEGPPLMAAVCDPLRKALRSGNPKDCDAAQGLESVCRAYLASDPSLCKVSGKLADVELVNPHPKAGEEAKVRMKEMVKAECQEMIAKRSIYAKGLREVAQSGSPSERVYAKAALGESDACGGLSEKVMQSCLAAAPAANAPVSSATTGKGAASPTAGQQGSAVAATPNAKPSTPGSVPDKAPR